MLDVWRGLLIAGCFLGLIAMAEWWRASYSVEVEWTRKLVHLGGGLVCLFIPFAIQSHWIVLFLAASMGAIFVISKRRGWLRSIHAVERHSHGTEYYPVVVYLLFLLTTDKPWVFVICMLVLAIADAAAALVGTRFGKIKITIEKDSKSLEGSLAFCLVTFVIVLLPLLIWRPLVGQPSPEETWHYALAASLIGMLVTCFELVSLKGRDNLFIPLGTYLVLTKTMQTDVPDLWMQNISFGSMLVAITLIAYLTRSFNLGGAIVVCLAAYGCWAMGSFDWALPVFLGYGLYLASTFAVDLPWRLTVRPVVYSMLPPILILAVGNVALNLDHSYITQFCFGPFLAACAVSLSQSVSNVVNWNFRKQPVRRWVHAALSGFTSFVVLVIPLAFRLQVFDPGTGASMLLTIIACAVTSGRLLPSIPPADAPYRWFYLRMGFSTVAAVVIGLLQWVGVSQIWVI